MKFFTLLMLSAFSLTAAAQTCYVDMVNRQHRVVATFTGYMNNYGCQEGMKQCRKALRMNPELGGSECIQQGEIGHSPIPAPVPVPVPVPGGNRPPRNAPQVVELTPLLLKISNVISFSEPKTKILETLILEVGSHTLGHFVSLCRPTRTWMENVQCLENGIRRAPLELVAEPVAIQAVGIACSKVTKTWFEEKACFEASLSLGQLSSLSYFAESCRQMWNSESSARCYRQVFRVQ